MLRPFACCCVLLGIAAESLRPSGDLGDLVERYCFYLPFETKLKKKNETNNNSQRKSHFFGSLWSKTSIL